MCVYIYVYESSNKPIFTSPLFTKETMKTTQLKLSVNDSQCKLFSM